MINYQKIQKSLNDTNTPISPLSPRIQKPNRIPTIIEDLLTSRELSSRAVLIYNSLQLGCLLFYCQKVYCWHLSLLFFHASNSDIYSYLTAMLPGLFLLPLLVSMAIWPVFCIIRLLILNEQNQLQTIQDQIDIFKKLQVHIISFFSDVRHKRQRNAFIDAIGTRIPNDLRWLILRAFDDDHEYRKSVVTRPLIKKRVKRIGETMASWDRVMLLWSLFTGFGENHAVRTHYTLKYKQFSVIVLCRDGFFVCLSCLLRFTLIIWITK